MPEATVVLDEEEIVVALQALRDYSDRLADAARHRRATDKHVARVRQLTGRVLERISDAYTRMDV